MTCEKPLVAAGVESGSDDTNQGLFGLPAPFLCPPALYSLVILLNLVYDLIAYCILQVKWCQSNAYTCNA